MSPGETNQKRGRDSNPPRAPYLRAKTKGSIIGGETGKGGMVPPQKFFEGKPRYVLPPPPF